jgi:small subunit ribosomal protein S11
MIHASLLAIAIAHISCTFNNTHISITTTTGLTLTSSSGGTVGLKGHKRSTSQASISISKLVALKCYKKGIRSLYVHLKGFGNGRKSCLTGLLLSGKINILGLKDVTTIPYNGCKASKKRRV